jgi:hypothetical protein
MKQIPSDGFLFGLFFDPEDGGDIFLWNIGCLSRDYGVLCPKNYEFHNYNWQNRKSYIMQWNVA